LKIFYTKKFFNQINWN